MSAIKTARKYIENHPHDADAEVLSDLVVALEVECGFALGELYSLSHDNFELALRVLAAWRTDSDYGAKARLFDASWHHRHVRHTEPHESESSASEASLERL